MDGESIRIDPKRCYVMIVKWIIRIELRRRNDMEMEENKKVVKGNQYESITGFSPWAIEKLQTDPRSPFYHGDK